MHELDWSCFCGHVFNYILGFSILMMYINPVESESLFCCVVCFLKLLGVKHTIIFMIVKYSDSIWITNAFKLQLRFKFGFWIQCGHQANISEFIIIIHKHGGSNIYCRRWVPFVSWDKTSSWDHKLINTDNLTNFCWRFNFILSGNIPGFVTPRMTVGFFMSTNWTSGGYLLDIYMGMIPDLDRSLSLENMIFPSLS